MNSDIRISTSFRGHRKFRKLKRRLDSDGIQALFVLWTRVAVSRPKGVLDGWNVEDILLERCCHR